MGNWKYLNTNARLCQSRAFVVSRGRRLVGLDHLAIVVPMRSEVPELVAPQVSDGDSGPFTPLESLNPFNVLLLAAGIVIPQTVGLKNVEIEEVPGIRISRLIAQLDPMKQEFVVTELCIKMSESDQHYSGDYTPINGTSLRQLPVDKYKYQAVAGQLYLVLDGDRGKPDTFLPFHLEASASLRLRAKEGPTDENLREVARIYSVSDFISKAPRKKVSESFGISPRTATNWINAARGKGFFGEE